MARTLVALYNSACNHEFLDKMKIAYAPVGYVMFTGALYVYWNEYWALPYSSEIKQHKGFDKVYAKLYVIQDEFYMKQLDAYHRCSLSMLRKNHIMDLSHRVRVPCIPIAFDDINSFMNLDYEEGDTVQIQTYIANPYNELMKEMIKKNRRHRCESASHYILNEIWRDTNGYGKSSKTL